MKDTPAVDPGTPTSNTRARTALAAASVAAATAVIAATTGVSGGVLAKLTANHNETVLG